MMELSYKHTSEVIRVLRFPMAMLVVAGHSYIHIAGWDFYRMDEQNLGSNLSAMVLTFGHTFPMFVIALFYLISGYLFFQHLEIWSWEIWRQKMKRRIFSLLLPFLFWNLLYWLYLGLPSVDGLWIRIFWANPDYPILMPFYFLRELMVVVALSPLFYELFRQRERTCQLMKYGALFVLFIPVLFQLSSPLPGLSYEAFLYFGMGAYFALNRMPLSDVAYKYRIWAIIFFPTLLIAMLWSGSFMTPEGRLIYPFYIIAEVFFMLYFASWVVKRCMIRPVTDWLISWQGASFLIFAFHIYIRPYAYKLVRLLGRVLTNTSDVWSMAYADKHPFLVVFFSVSIWFVMLISCMIFYRVLSRFLPRTCNLLCGR